MSRIPIPSFGISNDSQTKETVRGTERPIFEDMNTKKRDSRSSSTKDEDTRQKRPHRKKERRVNLNAAHVSDEFKGEVGTVPAVATMERKTDIFDVSDIIPSDEKNKAKDNVMNLLPSLLKVEAALQFSLLARGRNRRRGNVSSHKVSFSHLFEVVRNSMTINASNTLRGSSTGSISGFESMEIEEKLVFVLLTIGCPELFEISKNNKSMEVKALIQNRKEPILTRMDVMKKLYRERWRSNNDCEDASVAKKIYCVIEQQRNGSFKDSMEVQGNFVNQGQEFEVTRAKYSSFGIGTMCQREKKKARNGDAFLSNRSKKEHFIKPGMSLDERIIARAENKRLRNARVTLSPSNTNDTLCTETKKRFRNPLNQGSENNNILRFADALRLHVRHQTSRSTLFGNLGQSKDTETSVVGCTPTSVCIPVWELCFQLPYAAFSSLSNNTAIKGASLAKLSATREVMQMILELCKCVPDWIRVVDKRSNSKNEFQNAFEAQSISENHDDNTNGYLFPYSKAAVVIIQQALSYQKVRERLGAKFDRNVRFKTCEERINSSKRKKKSIIKDSNNEYTCGKVQATPLEQKDSLINLHSKPQNQLSLNYARFERRDRTNIDDHASHAQNEKMECSKIPSSPASESLHLLKRPRVGTNVSRGLPVKAESSLHTMNHENKLNKSLGSNQMLQLTRKKKNPLRVNQLLHFNEADGDGGIVIQPSSTTNPRGLKRLFSQLNSGERI